jgi:transposase
MSRLYIGLDVHSKQTSFVIQDEQGAIVGDSSIPTTVEGFQKLKVDYGCEADTPVGLETGTVSFFVARVLARLGLKPIVIDAREVRAKARRPNQKCDSRDALEICHGVRTQIYQSIVHIPPEEVTELRETLSRRRHFVRQATSEVNAAKRLLRSAGLRSLATVTLKSETGWNKLVKLLGSEDGLLVFVSAHFKMWQQARQLITELDAKLEVLEKQPAFAEPSRRLQTISGVGRVVALTAIAVLSDIARFPSAKHVASYAGIVPSTFHSGDREASGRITRRGSAELRAMLCEAAHHAASASHPLNPFFTEICARRGYKMAVTAVAHRLVRIMYAMLKNGTDFDVTKLPVEAGPFTKKRVVAYRRTKKPVTRSRAEALL